jgi:hypothetical protein
MAARSRLKGRALLALHADDDFARNYGRVMSGWSRKGWIEWCRRMADVCSDMNPQRSRQWTAWAESLERKDVARKDQA